MMNVNQYCHSESIIVIPNSLIVILNGVKNLQAVVTRDASCLSMTKKKSCHSERSEESSSSGYKRCFVPQHDKKEKLSF